MKSLKKLWFQKKKDNALWVEFAQSPYRLQGPFEIKAQTPTGDFLGIDKDGDGVMIDKNLAKLEKWKKFDMGPA